MKRFLAFHARQQNPVLTEQLRRAEAQRQRARLESSHPRFQLCTAHAFKFAFSTKRDMRTNQASLNRVQQPANSLQIGSHWIRNKQSELNSGCL